MHLSKDPPRLTHLGSDCLKVRILGRTIVVQQVQAVPAQLDQPLGIIGQSDDQRVFGLGQLRRQRHSWYMGYIGSLDPPVGQIQTSRRFRGTRHADQTDIGIVETPTRLAVIMIEGKRNRVDTRKILTVEQMLFARHPTALAMEVGSQRADDRIENRYGRLLQPAAALLQQLAKSVVDHGEQNDPGIGFNPGYHPVDLAAAAHHTPDMLDGLSVVELHKAGPSHGMHGFSGGIGNEVKMKAGHRNLARFIPARCESFETKYRKTRLNGAPCSDFPQLAPARPSVVPWRCRLFPAWANRA